MEQQERADRIRRQNMSACMRTAREFMSEEDAVGVVEIILILVVLISLVIIFKEQLTNLVRSILSKITKQSNSI
jgi:Flp pilus assembly pilin Flp